MSNIANEGTSGTTKGETGQDDRKKYFVGLFVVAVLCSALAYWYWTTTPQYSLKCVSKAIETHDLGMFEKYVDVDSLVSRAADQIGDGILNESKDKLNSPNMNQGVTQLAKPMLINESKEQIKAYIEKGSFESSRQPILDKQQKSNYDTIIAEKYINTGGNFPQSKGIDYIKKDGKVAALGLSIFYPNIESTIVLEIKMRERDGYWQVIEISNFKEFFANLDIAKRAYYNTPPAQIKPIQVTTKEYKDYNCTFKYPQIEIAGNPSAQDKINKYIQDRISKGIERGKSIAQLEKDHEKNGRHYVCNMDYKVGINDGKLLSMSFTDYAFTGGAHGMSARVGATFDAKTGDLLRWDDLYPIVDDNVRMKINDNVRQQIREKNIAIFSPYKGIGKSKIPTFYLSENRKAVIVFQHYEIAPYSSGILEFEVTL